MGLTRPLRHSKLHEPGSIAVRISQNRALISSVPVPAAAPRRYRPTRIVHLAPLRSRLRPAPPPVASRIHRVAPLAGFPVSFSPLVGISAGFTPDTLAFSSRISGRDKPGLPRIQTQPPLTPSRAGARSPRVRSRWSRRVSPSGWRGETPRCGRSAPRVR